MRLLAPVALVFAMLGATSDAASVREGPRPLTAPLTVLCAPDTVTETGSFTPRTLIVVHASYSSRDSWIVVWSNDLAYHAVLGKDSAWWSKKTCKKASLPIDLPAAKLVRLVDLRMTCAVPGRRLLVHATPRRRNGTALTLRAMPHGQLLAHVLLRGREVRAFASNYAVRLCDLNGTR
jgi:hypothetical protein